MMQELKLFRPALRVIPERPSLCGGKLDSPKLNIEIEALLGDEGSCRLIASIPHTSGEKIPYNQSEISALEAAAAHFELVAVSARKMAEELKCG